MKTKLLFLTILSAFVLTTTINAQSVPYPPTDSYITFDRDGTFSQSVTIEGKYGAPYYIFEFTVPTDNLYITGSVYQQQFNATIPFIERLEGYYVVETIYNTRSDKQNFRMQVKAGKYRLIVSGLGGQPCHTSISVR